MQQAAAYCLSMRNGETKKIGNATVVCSVQRSSWTRREDKWMGRSAPRYSFSQTFYRVVDASGKTVATLIEGYKNAVKIAEDV